MDTDMATDFVDNQPADAWTDAFYVMGDSYDLQLHMHVAHHRVSGHATTTLCLAGRLEI